MFEGMANFAVRTWAGSSAAKLSSPNATCLESIGSYHYGTLGSVFQDASRPSDRAVREQQYSYESAAEGYRGPRPLLFRRTLLQVARTRSRARECVFMAVA